MACVNKGAFEAIGEEENTSTNGLQPGWGALIRAFCGFHGSARIEDAGKACRPFPFDTTCFFARENSTIKRKERRSGLVLAAARKELLLLLELPPTCRLLQDRPKSLRRGVRGILASQIAWWKEQGRALGFGRRANEEERTAPQTTRFIPAESASGVLS